MTRSVQSFLGNLKRGFVDRSTVGLIGYPMLVHGNSGKPR